eukprot:scaffold23590_cov42-Prasinocladus_malaysianus.AAC.1
MAAADVSFECRLGRCTDVTTGEEGQLPRCKPFKWTYEKEIVMYAYFKGLDYFCTECIYAPFAARGFARELVKDLEVRSICPELGGPALRHCGCDSFWGGDENTERQQQRSRQCTVEARHVRALRLHQQSGESTGILDVTRVCKACVLLEGLNTGNAKLGISRTR